MTKIVVLVLLAIVSLCSSAQRIVSLVPSVTQTLQQIGADDRVVARTTLCPVAIKGQNVVVGDVLTVNVEKIVAMKPTAIVTMGFTSEEVITKLRKLGLKVVTLQTPSTFDEMCEQTIELGRLAKCEEAAKRYIKEVKDSVAYISKSIKQKDYKCFFQVGTKPLWGAYPQMYLDDMIGKMGGINIVNMGNGSVSREKVVASQPDVIVMTTMGGLWREESDMWRKLCKKTTLIVVDENEAGCPTPLNFYKTMKKILSDKFFVEFINSKK